MGFICLAGDGAWLKMRVREATRVDLIHHQVLLGGLDAMGRVVEGFRAQLHANAFGRHRAQWISSR